MMNDSTGNMAGIVDQSANATASGQETDSTIARAAPDPEEQRKALVSEWSDRVKRARAYWEERAFRQMRKDMAFAAGHQWPVNQIDELVDEASERYIANITLRHIARRTAAIYGKNPTIVARRKKRLLSTVWDGSSDTLKAAMQAAAQNPMNTMAQAILKDAATTMERHQQLDRIAQTLEILFENELDEQPVSFKTQMKAAVRRALTTSVGYVKLGYQRLMSRSPDTEAKINDITQRLANLERLSADLADGEAQQDSAEAESFRLALEALSKEQEVVVREGLTVGYPDSTSIIPDTGCKQLRGFVGCDWVAEEYFLTADKIKEVYRVDIRAGGAKAYASEKDGLFQESNSVTGEEKKGAEHFCVWEIYNKTDGLVYVVCDGHPDFLTQPAAPDVWLERFYPWFVLVFNEVYYEGAVYPPSDVALMRDMQMELNRARQGLREHRRASRPKTFTRKGALEQDDKDKLIGCQANEIVELQGLQPNENIRDLLQPFAGPGIDPNVYDTGPAYEDYKRTLGQTEANLGGASGATATESSIAEGSRVSDSSAVVDDLDEFLSEIARAGGQILLSEASPERVKEVVGPGAIWPDLSRAEIAKEIYLDVEAASTGRPNQAQQIQAAQQVFPLLMQVPGISPEWMARELLRRLDDKVDLSDAFASGLPSIMALNAANTASANQSPGQPPPPAAQASGNAPADQGPQGANNAPNPEPPQVNTAPRPPDGMPQNPQG